jgi:hypothetical protein
VYSPPRQPHFSSHFRSWGQKVFFRALFSNSVSLCSFLSIRGQASRSYKITCNFILIYIS